MWPGIPDRVLFALKISRDEYSTRPVEYISRIWNVKNTLKHWQITLFFMHVGITHFQWQTCNVATLASKFLKICTFENAIVVNNLIQL